LDEVYPGGMSAARSTAPHMFGAESPLPAAARPWWHTAALGLVVGSFFGPIGALVGGAVGTAVGRV